MLINKYIKIKLEIKYTLRPKIIAHLEFEFFPIKKCYFDPTTIKDKSFRSLLTKETNNVWNLLIKDKGYFCNFTLYIGLRVWF